MYKGIDVSDNQGVINWGKVKAAGVQFAVLRSVRRSGKADNQFANNVAGCRANSIPFSVYKYTYATTEDAARTEAQQVIALLESINADKSTIVWWDVEDRDTLWKLGWDKLTALISAAKAVIVAAGYRFGLYVGLYVYRESWFDFTPFAADPLWVARYPSKAQKDLSYNPAEKYKPSVGRAIWGWQYSSNGKVDGISGPVDLDICYTDPTPQEQQKEESGVIYTVSVADVWTREQAEALQRQFAAIGINGVVHKCRILE